MQLRPGPEVDLDSWMVQYLLSDVDVDDVVEDIDPHVDIVDEVDLDFRMVQLGLFEVDTEDIGDDEVDMIVEIDVYQLVVDMDGILLVH